MRKSVLLLLILLALPVGTWALSGKGTTAGSFLKIGMGARAVAMGEAFVAVANEASAVYWNPAGLQQVQTSEIMAMHIFWLEDIFYDNLAGVWPLTNSAIGASLIYLNGGSIPRAEASDTPESEDRGMFSAADMALLGGYSYAYSPALDLGAGLVVFSESIDAQSSLGWALNLGVLYKLPWSGWVMGGAVQNLGPATAVQEEYFRLPINFKAGVSFQPVEEFLVALDFNQLLEQGGKISLGAEYWFENLLAIRVGYKYQERVDNEELYSDYGSNLASGLSGGIGIKYQMLRFDYAFVPYGFLGSTHRLAFTYQLPAIPAQNSK